MTQVTADDGDGGAFCRVTEITEATEMAKQTLCEPGVCAVPLR